MTPVFVLVVDDDIDFAKTLAELLRLNGLRSVACQSASEALTVAERERPQAAVIDLAMPKMTGLDLARRIRATVWGAEIPMIGISGFGRQRDHDAAREAGVDQLLLKPASIEEVLRALEAHPGVAKVSCGERAVGRPKADA